VPKLYCGQYISRPLNQQIYVFQIWALRTRMCKTIACSNVLYHLCLHKPRDASRDCFRGCEWYVKTRRNSSQHGGKLSAYSMKKSNMYRKQMPLTFCAGARTCGTSSREIASPVGVSRCSTPVGARKTLWLASEENPSEEKRTVSQSCRRIDRRTERCQGM
jgi:hypothetical protein